MFFAEDPNTGRIVPAVRGNTATCPACRGEVFGRGGVTELIRVHWAHREGGDCDTWAEKFETQEAGEWHADWQALAVDARLEVTMKRDGIHHRADIVSRDGQVVEIQHSTINKMQIEDREQFYGNMSWIWDTRRQYENNLKVLPPPDPELPDSYRTFAWKAPRKSLLFSVKRSLFDLGDGRLLFVGRIGGTPGVLHGWGFLVDKATVVEWINEGVPDLPNDPWTELQERRAEEQRRIRAEQEAERERVRLEYLKQQDERTQARLAADTERAAQLRIHIAEDLEDRASSAEWSFDQRVQEVLRWQEREVEKRRLVAEERRLMQERDRLWFEAQRAVCLDWSNGATHSNRGRPAFCVHCGRPAMLLDKHGQPAHKVCVQYAIHTGVIRDENVLA